MIVVSLFFFTWEFWRKTLLSYWGEVLLGIKIQRKCREIAFIISRKQRKIFVSKVWANKVLVEVIIFSTTISPDLLMKHSARSTKEVSVFWSFRFYGNWLLFPFFWNWWRWNKNKPNRIIFRLISLFSAFFILLVSQFHLLYFHLSCLVTDAF